MAKWVWSIVLCALVGCAGPKKTEKQLELIEGSEQLSLRVSSANGKYTVSFRLIRFSGGQDDAWMAGGGDRVNPAAVREMEWRGEADVLYAPVTTVKPNEWDTLTVVQRVHGYQTTVEWMVDGELVETPAHAGMVLKTKIEPQTTGKVHVKGLLCLSEFDASGAFIVRPFPFDVMCSLNEDIIVYRKQSRWNKQALQQFNGGDQ